MNHRGTTKGNAMKRSLITLACASLVTTMAVADQSTDELRREFEAYKKATEARMADLEKKAQAPSTAKNGASPADSLTTKEIETIRERMDGRALTFGFYGYFRSGLGVDDDGKAQSAFRAPNADAKYRLGNEAETYAETGFSSKSKLKDDDTVSFNSYILLAYVTPNANNSSYEATTSLREAYAEAAGTLEWNKSTVFWAGQRYHSRYDVHMNDFYYRDMSGFGGGFSDMLLPDGTTKLGLAWLGGSVDKLNSNGTGFFDDDGQFNKNSLDLTISEIPLPGGSLDAMLTVSHFEGDSITNSTGYLDLNSNWGASVGLVYTTKLRDGKRNRLVAQYGQGSAYNFKSIMTLPTALDYSVIDSVDVNNMQTIRFLDEIACNLSERWTLQGVAIYQNSDIGTEEDNNVTWISFGLRPAYHFNRFFSIETEFGYDYTDTENAESGDLFKVTIAPQITPDMDVFSRPSLRIFLTYASWDDDFRGLVGVPSYTEDTSGISAGVQVETWF
jgi:maltoporin